ncbi:hypothetical protein HYZ41_00680 [archaeon]|nr:hypothetical protein [archaeon]
MTEYMKDMKARFDTAMYVLKAIAGFGNASLFDFDINFEITDREMSESLTRMNKQTGYKFVDESLSREKIKLYKDTLYVEPNIGGRVQKNKIILN